MNIYRLPYGQREVSLEIPASLKTDVIAQANPVPHPDPLQAVDDALNQPCAGKRLEDFPAPRRVSIAINDKTRPVPHRALLLPILQRLEQLDVPKSMIQLVIASGTHDPMRVDEFPLILPQEMIANHPIAVHDCDQGENLVQLGTSPAGTPVFVNRDFYEADLKIVIGNIEPHHFMGFSGGVKTAAVGLGGRETIRRNHAFITHPEARLGIYEQNPMRQDVEEIGKMMGVDYAVNAILNENLELVHAVAGLPLAVMAAGIPLSRAVCQVPVSGKYDIVVASCGGYPKDINLYQAQKAQSNAAMLVKPGGTIILIAECAEGIGSTGYEEFMRGVQSSQQAIQKFRQQDFQLGPHKAYLFARIAQKCETVLVSSIPADVVHTYLLKPAPDVHVALQYALGRASGTASIALMPHAVATAPLVATSSVA